MNSSGHYALYAELLANIRQISLAASLPSASDASTQVALSADGRTVELRHGGRDHHLTLPAKAGLGGTLLPIQDKQKGTRALSWRLPLDAASLSPSHQADHTPWSATDLGPDSGVACRQCSTNVVPAGSVKAWKDLPSENWAEMMEFWHCHKPDHHHSHEEETGKADEQTLAARGYGASSVISAQEGVGFVDLTTLLFAESDCRSVTTQLGFFNLRTSAVTLLKWQISSQSTSGAVPGIPECLAATLISTISRSGSSKSLITPILIPSETAPPPQHQHGNEKPAASVQDDAIHIWVLNSSIVYSSSSSSNSSNSSNSSSSNAAPQQRTPAIKLLYRAIPCAEADKLLEAVTCDAQEINLPAQALREVLRHLGESNARLPPTERVFKEWKVGLLTRWESKVV